MHTSGFLTNSEKIINLTKLFAVYNIYNIYSTRAIILPQSLEIRLIVFLSFFPLFSKSKKMDKKKCVMCYEFLKIFLSHFIQVNMSKNTLNGRHFYSIIKL